MPLNPYFSSETQGQGSLNEQMVLEDLIEESIQVFGQEFLYMPRKLVDKDEILGEDRLSVFNEAVPVEMYLETPMGFGGQNEFIAKFGYMMEQTMDLTMSRRRWYELIGRHGRSILPDRPAEGDLIFYAPANKIFEIKFVEKEAVFFQLGKLYTFKLTVETFQYASERLDTGIPSIDLFEAHHTLITDPVIAGNGYVASVMITAQGSGYTTAPTITFEGGECVGTEATATATVSGGMLTSITITNPGMGYSTVPTVVITGTGTGATAVATLAADIDTQDNFGDNRKFRNEAIDIVFDANNPFGEI